MPVMANSSPDRRYWLRSSLLTLLEKGTALAFALGTVVLLLRGLSKADFAAWGLFLLITYFLEMGRMGLIQNGLVRYLTLHRGQPDEYSAILSAALALNLLFSVVSNLLLWAGTGWLVRTWHTPQLAALLPVYFATNFVMALFYQTNFVQQANFEFRGIFWATFFYRGALFFWVLYCWASGAPLRLEALAGAMLIGAALGTAASWWYARPFLTFLRGIDLQWAKKLVRYGKYGLGTNLSAMFYKNIDKLMLGNLLGPAAFAVYDAAGRITQLIETPSFSMAAVVFPKSAQRAESEGPAGISRLYERSVGAILAFILPFVALAVVFARPLVALLAGPAYADSAGVLRLTALFGLFLPFAVQFGTVLDSTGRPAVNFAYTLLTAGLNFALSFFFIKSLGLYGAALATLTGYFLSFLFMQRLLARDYGVRWWRAFGYVPDFYAMAFGLLKNRFFNGR